MRFLLHEDSGKGLTHDIASAYNHDVFPFDGDATCFKKDFDSVRGTRKKPILVTEQHFPHIERMKSIDIFLRPNSGSDRLFMDMVRKRQLDENAIDVRIVIELINFF